MIDHAAIDQQRRERLALLSDPREITDAEAIPWLMAGLSLAALIVLLVTVTWWSWEPIR